MTGYDKAREIANDLKKEKVEKEEQKEKAVAEIKNSLAAIAENRELSQMYADNANLGAENLAGELPLLKIHATGRSRKNFLSDGKAPQDGNFFYKPTSEEFEELDVHILTISRGFRAEGLEGNKKVFNQMIGGVIIDNGNYKPFVMYFTGLKLSYLWEFGKEAGKYTRAKPIPIPMFALTIHLKTKSVENSINTSWIVEFEIVKNEDGSPKIILDPGLFNYLKDSVKTVEETIGSVIDAKENKEGIDEDPVKRAQDVEGVDDSEEDPNDRPF